jgi:signal transduction histidine kinase
VPAAENKNIALLIDVKLGFPCARDRDRLFEAIANLIDNAIKFTPEGGRVTIEPTRGDNEIILRITDIGCGISRHEQEANVRAKPLLKCLISLRERSPPIPSLSRRDG